MRTNDTVPEPKPRLGPENKIDYFVGHINRNRMLESTLRHGLVMAVQEGVDKRYGHAHSAASTSQSFHWTTQRFLIVMTLITLAISETGRLVHRFGGTLLASSASFLWVGAANGCDE